MYNKLKKNYLKKIIAITLVIGFAFTNYAALSSSDGSSFVTKAEFDSALSDFNSRLTTFEAGINSKIDSQVSSYLDRNGIWSGKKQPINESVAGKLGIRGLATKQWGNPGGYQNRQQVGDSEHTKLKAEDSKTIIVVNSLTKSGLCLAELGMTYSGSIRVAGADSDPFMLNHAYMVKMVLSFFSDGVMKYNWFDVRSWTVAANLSAGDAFNLKAYFFVDKNNDLSLKSESILPHDCSDWDKRGASAWWGLEPKVTAVTVY